LHSVCNIIDVVFSDFEITKASIHDIHYLKNIKLNHCNSTLLGDKGYLSVDYQMNLFEQNNIKLEVPMRINQKDYHPQTFIFRKNKKTD